MWRVVLITFFLAGYFSSVVADPVLPERWRGVFADAPEIADTTARIEYFSSHFLDTPYQANTLGGGANQPEKLIINFDAVDCFTLIDYVEAMRRCVTLEEFDSRLIDVRYLNQQISWEKRKHFFSDWVEAIEIEDVTGLVGGGAVRTVEKKLNSQSGALLLSNVAIRERSMKWLPSKDLGPALPRLQTGDYLGVYSEHPWLDVSHVGIVVRKEGKIYLRHASSRPGVLKVVDSFLPDYLEDKPGIVVLRAVAP